MLYTMLILQWILFFEVSPKWRFFGLRKTMEHTDQRDQGLNIFCDPWFIYKVQAPYQVHLWFPSHLLPPPMHTASVVQGGFTAVGCALPSMADSSKTGHVTHRRRKACLPGNFPYSKKKLLNTSSICYLVNKLIGNWGKQSFFNIC